MAALALTAGTVERLANEVRHLMRSEVAELREPFGDKQKGSSAMPHKRNPVIAERLCGLARVIRGNLQVALENTALWHERDISHSSAERIVFPDSCELLGFMLSEATRMVEGLVVFPERMAANLGVAGGIVYSQRVLLALVEKGMAREDAYLMVQTAALKAWDEQGDFRALIEADADVTRLLTAAEIEELFDPRWHLRHIDITYKRAGIGEER
jgi:adenylosuccinate lyase